MAIRPDLGGLPAGGVSTLLLLVLFGSLRDVGVVDQAAEQRGNLGPDVQLLLMVGGRGDIRIMFNCTTKKKKVKMKVKTSNKARFLS